MAIWLIKAIQIIAASFAGEAAFQTGSDLMTQRVAFDPSGTYDPGGFDQFYPRSATGSVLSMRPRMKRRRRRRALTASDRGDIAFITGLLGPTAGKNFAVTLAGRSR